MRNSKRQILKATKLSTHPSAGHFRQPPIKSSRLLSLPLLAGLLFCAVSIATKSVSSGPVQTRTLQAYVEYSTSNLFSVGSMVVVQVSDPLLASNSARGTVRIASASARYDSGEKSMVFSSDGRSLYYRWHTIGLKAATDYEVTSVIRDNTSSWTASMQIMLRPPITKLIRTLASVEDLRLPFRDVGLHFTRHYRYEPSYGPYKGSLGFVWTHAFGSILSEDTDGYISLFDGNGTGRYYQNNGDGTYQSAVGDRSRLARNADGSFTLRSADGIIQRFRNDLLLDFYQDRDGNKVSCSYDSKGHLISLSDQANQEIRFITDTEGRIAQAIDSTGRAVRYTYDQSGNLHSVTDPSGSTTVYKYDDQHRLLEIDFPNGERRFFSYDIEGLLSQVSANGGSDTLTLTYDHITGKQTITDATGRKIVASTNESGILTAWENGLGITTRLEYDDDFNLVRFIDGRGNAWNIVPDTRGNPSRIRNPEGHSVALAYSTEFNQVTSVTDGKANRMQFDYDNRGNLTRTIYPDGTSEVNSISDVSGVRTIQRRRRDGRTHTYIYNLRGLLETEILPDGSRKSYSYDLQGNLTSATNSWGTITFGYDLLNRLTSTTYRGNRSFLYEYDSRSRRNKMTDPDGRVLEYIYNTAGRLSRISSPTEGAIVEYTYDLAGRLIRRSFANGVFTEYEYDTGGQLTAIISRKGASEIISSWRYEYDASGNRLQKTGPEGTEVYTYDKTSQLVGVGYPDATAEAYEYDPAGNRSAVIKNGAREKWKVNSLNQYTKAAGSKYSYDSDGNLIRKKKNDTATYEYDSEDRLIRAQLQGGEAVSYAYDAFGRLASRTDSRGTVHFLWDGDRIAIEEDSSHSTVARYTWGRTLSDAVHMQKGGQDHFYIQDALFSVTELTDSTGKVVDRYRYRVFGEPSSSSRVSNPFMFAGAYFDSQIGLYYMRARWHSPALGRFVQTDPIGISGGINLYSYVFNNPVNYRDPRGARYIGNSPFEAQVVPLTVQGPPMAAAPPTPPPQDPGPDLFEEYSNNQDSQREPSRDGPKSDIGGGVCPTFIQVPPDVEMVTYTHGNLDASQQSLVARIDVPVSNSLLRSDIPIFGVAGGKEFKKYQVEYGEGTAPSKWHLIDSSTTPQPKNDVGIAEMRNMQGDIDIRGNLATWNTGLKEWVHLPWHPPDDPTDFNGTYTIRLVVTGKDGKTVEDRVTCEVGRVIAQCLPGMAISTDKKVTMHFPQQSIQAAFRVYAIKSLSSDVPPAPRDQSLVGTVYTIREPGDRFMKAVTLRFDVGKQSGRHGLDHLGIFSFNTSKNDWELMPTVHSDQPHMLETIIFGLPEKAAYFAVFASKVNQQQSIKRQSAPVAPVVSISSRLSSDQPVFAFNTFESDTHEWKARDREFGATISRDQTATVNGTYCLKVTNDHFGGNFACTVSSTSFSADDYSQVSFDYKVMAGVKTDLYVRVGQTWYNIGFTDDENDFKYKDVGISRIGKIEGIISDGQWHSASFNLDNMLAQKTGQRLVEEMVMADWDVGGYMKLEFGRNARGATFYIDNFKIYRGAQEHLSLNEERSELVVDDFESKRTTNSLGGEFGIFSNAGINDCVLDFVPTAAATNAATDNALSLKYDVTRRGSFAGLWSSLQGASLEDFDQLSMRVRIVSGSNYFLVGLKNRSMNEMKLPVSNYLKAPDVFGWQELVIPLAAFKGMGEMSAMEVLSISFTEASRSGKGEVIVDDIKFKKGLDCILVADFEQIEIGKNLLMQDSWIFMRGAGAIAAMIDAARASDPEGHCVRISYGGTIGLDLGGGDFSYAAWATGLGGVDASRLKYLKLMIKGQKGGEKPNVYLDDGTTRRCVDIEKYRAVTTQWQEVFIPLQDFARQGVDLTHLEGIQLVFEWEPMSGTLYLDDIELSKDRILERWQKNNGENSLTLVKGGSQ